MLDKNPLEWHNTPTYGGIGAPVGLTVFKTAGGSLGAAPDRFDSYTPLPELMYIGCEQCLFTHGFAGAARLCFLFVPAKLCSPLTH